MRRLIDEHAAEVLDSGMATAAAVAVTDRDRTVIAGSYSAADDALWPIASVGKAFAAVIALQLADDGTLDLHAPVPDSLPWFSVRTRYAPITLHHLLTHTSGLIESSDRAPASNYDVLGLEDTEAGFAPGEHRHYSNVGYRVVGAAVEEITCESYGELVQRRVFDRLALTDSVPTMTHESRRRIPPGHAPRFDDRPWLPEHGLVPAPWVESAEADGCSCCTIEELAAVARALWREDEALLSSAGFTAMKTPWPPDEGDAYGYGLELDPRGFGHGGDMLGHVSHMRVDLDVRAGRRGVRERVRRSRGGSARLRSPSAPAGRRPRPSPAPRSPCWMTAAEGTSCGAASVATAPTTRGCRRSPWRRATVHSCSARTGSTGAGASRCSRSSQDVSEIGERTLDAGAACVRHSPHGGIPAGASTPARRTTGRSPECEKSARACRATSCRASAWAGGVPWRPGGPLAERGPWRSPSSPGGLVVSALAAGARA